MGWPLSVSFSDIYMVKIENDMADWCHCKYWLPKIKTPQSLYIIKVSPVTIS